MEVALKLNKSESWMIGRNCQVWCEINEVQDTVSCCIWRSALRKTPLKDIIMPAVSILSVSRNQRIEFIYPSQMEGNKFKDFAEE